MTNEPRVAATSPLEHSIARGEGVVVFEVRRPGGGVHDHLFRVKRITGQPGTGYDYFYLEFEEPGACSCVRRVDLAVLTHAMLNTTPQEVAALEDREVCANCGHNHHVDDEAVAL